jgi:hypothetical protein
LLAGADLPNAIFETFRVENVPQQHAEAPTAVSGSEQSTGNTTENAVSEELF